jgi:hypothetical protein
MAIAMHTCNLDAQMFTQEIQLNYLLTLATLVSEERFRNHVTINCCWSWDLVVQIEI